MKQNRIFHRALSLFLLVAMLAGFAVPIRATKASSDLPLEMEQIENSSVTAELPQEPMGSIPNEASTGAASGGGASDDSMVRVSIQLEKPLPLTRVLRSNTLRKMQRPCATGTV